MILLKVKKGTCLLLLRGVWFSKNYANVMRNIKKRYRTFEIRIFTNKLNDKSRRQKSPFRFFGAEPSRLKNKNKVVITLLPVPNSLTMFF